MNFPSQTLESLNNKLAKSDEDRSLVGERTVIVLCRALIGQFGLWFHDRELNGNSSLDNSAIKKDIQEKKVQL